MVGGVFAKNIDDPGACRFEIGKVGKRVSKSRTEMKKRRGRFAGHPEIAVSRARRHGLMQTQNATHAIDPVEGRHKMHFRGAGIGEADLNAAGQKAADEALGSVHCLRCDVVHFKGEKNVGTKMRFSRALSSGIEASRYALQSGAAKSLSRRCSRSAMFWYFHICTT